MDDGFVPAIIEKWSKSITTPPGEKAGDAGSKIRATLLGFLLQPALLAETIIVADACEYEEITPEQMVEIDSAAISPKKNNNYPLYQSPSVNLLYQLQM